MISGVVGLDPVGVARYREPARSSIERHDRRYLTGVGAEIQRVEGDWDPRNVVVVAFPSMARARQWYASPEYAEALEVRRTALRRSVIFVAGVDEGDAPA